MHTCNSCSASRCGPTLDRRGFLAGAAAAVAAEAGLLDFASSLFAAQPRPAGKPVVNVLFVRSEVTPIVSWPGGNCNVAAQQALFTKTLDDAARQLGVQLDVRAKPIAKKEEVGAYLKQIKKAPPDGLIVCAMELELWSQVDQVVQGRGNVPTVVYSNVSGFTSNLQCGRNTPGTYLGATQDVGWLAFALRMLNTIWLAKHTRILFVAGGENQGGDRGRPGHGVPLDSQSAVRRRVPAGRRRRRSPRHCRFLFQKCPENRRAHPGGHPRRRQELRRLPAAYGGRGLPGHRHRLPGLEESRLPGLQQAAR